MCRLEPGEGRGEQTLPLRILEEQVESALNKLSFEELRMLQGEAPLER